MFSHKETLFLTGLTEDTLLTWHKRGFLENSVDVVFSKQAPSSRGSIVQPDKPTLLPELKKVPRWDKPGRGNRRKYSYRAVADLLGMRILVGFGIPVGNAASLAARISGCWEAASSDLRTLPQDAAGVLMWHEHLEVGRPDRFWLIYPEGSGFSMKCALEADADAGPDGESSLSRMLRRIDQPAAILIDIAAILGGLKERLKQVEMQRVKDAERGGE